MRSVRVNLTPTVAPGQRIAAVDELKGVAIALVIIYHSEGLARGPPASCMARLAWIFFLILSGFTLAVNSTAIPLRQFFTRRLFRIYPAYWIAVASALFFGRRLYGATYDWGNIVAHVIGVQAFSRIAYFPAISDPFWFISMILAAYLVFACIRGHLDNLALVCAVAGGLMVFATICYQNEGSSGGLYYLAERIPDFFVGVIAGRLLSVGTAEIRFNMVLGLGLLCFYYEAFFRSAQDTYLLPAIGLIAAWIGVRRLIVRTWPGRALLTGFSLLGIISVRGVSLSSADPPRLQQLCLGPLPPCPACEPH